MYTKRGIIAHLERGVAIGGSATFCHEGMADALKLIKESVKPAELLPKEPTDEMLLALRSGFLGYKVADFGANDVARAQFTRAYRHFRDRLVPKKVVTKWYCAWAYTPSFGARPEFAIASFDNEAAADAQREAALKEPRYYSLVGPVYKIDTEVDQ